MSSEKPQDLEAASQAIASGDAMGAFTIMKPWIFWPAEFESGADWTDTWTVFADIAKEIAGVEVADTVQAAAESPRDAHALYALGYELIEVGLPRAAATALARADAIAPGNEPVVAEYVHALETSGFNEPAVEVLQANPEMVAESFILQYLLAFNAIMSANLEVAEEASKGFEPEDEEQMFMASRIERFLERAQGISRVTTLTDRDLRGWHLVTNGALLLHLSPYGLDEPMFGRYAFVQDTLELCHEGVQRLAEIAKIWKNDTKNIFYLGDLGSEVLAKVLAKTLGTTAKPWPRGGFTDPCIVVAYDLSEATDDELAVLYNREPGQLLWSHAACWTDVPPFAADVHTFLYQHNIAPWGERLHFDDEAQGVVRTETESVDADTWVERVLDAELNEEHLDDLDELRALARVSENLTEGAEPTALVKVPVNRPRFWDSSPVKSNRFA